MSDHETLTRSVFHRLGSVLWGIAVVGVVVLALYVSVGRTLVGNLQAFQGDVMAALNARVPFRIEAAALSGEWHAFTPEIVLTGLRVSLPGDNLDPLELSTGRVGIDVPGTLLTRSLQFTSLQLDNLELRGELQSDGRLVFPGLGGSNPDVSRWLRDFLLNIEYVTLRGNVLQLTLPSGEQRRLALDLHLAREGSSRELQARLVSTRGVTVGVAGRGVGDPFQPESFKGQLYLDVGSTDVEAVRDLLVREPPLWMEGQLDSRWWLAWDRGQLDIDLQLQFDNLRLFPREGDWSVPLDELSLSASLVERRNRRTVFASDLVARRGEAEIRVPRLQLDAWGESVRLRTRALDVAALSALVQALGVMPDTLQSVFETLDARGSLDNLQVSVADLGAPRDNWEVEANFDGLAVDSWHGAPGVQAAHGYVEMAPSGGRIVLDSQGLSMAFPTVYEQPLFYDDFFGTIFLDWDSDVLSLDSGPVTASGVEGTARALFGLTIPLKPGAAGLEMDLMVGLADSHPVHRVKYVPTVLDENLRNWLADAVGDGDIRQGAFIWRGSLQRDAGDLRTVQLFFNVANTSLAYHPQWPPVDRVNGVVLIDDTSVSVWADSARMYDSTLERLSVEAWMDDFSQVQLAVDASLSGPAADGLRIVNESVLGELTDGAFNRWQAQGELQAQLQLSLNLADVRASPAIELRTWLQDVAVAIEPGGLQVADIAGELGYSSASGFSSQDLGGMLWGKPLQIQLQQRPLSKVAPSMAPGESAVEVVLETRVAMDDLHAWLDLPALDLATGETALRGKVDIRPGEVPTLQLISDLAGTALDLPAPWAIKVEESRDFSLRLPLGSGAGPLELQLGSDVDLLLGISGGRFGGASLGVGRAPPEIASGVVRVAGQAELLDVDDWLRFIDTYLSSPEAQQAEAAAATEALRIRVDDLHVGRVRLGARQVEDIRFSFALDERAWQLRAETDWVRGSYFQPADGRAGLKLDYLDVTGLSAALAGEGDAAPDLPGGRLEIPDMQVVISDLHRAGVRLGSLQFQLASDDPIIQASGIQGELAGLRLSPEQPARVAWEQGLETRLEAVLQFDDFGDTLDALEFPRFLQTESGQFRLALAWPQSPADFALNNLQGSLEIDVQRGTFLETPTGATGALKILSILNLAEIVQQLSLAHMFESGVPFRQMGGQVSFASGTIELPDLAILGSSSSFNFSGSSRIADRSLDGELVATLPVASNLPWVAALAGGLPVAAGVFVVSKVFEKQVNRLSSGVYAIGGTWEEPTVTFDRIFDNAARGAGATSPVPGPLAAGEDRAVVTGGEAADANEPATTDMPAQ